ncbi:NAD(P)-dependent oxidoreductase [Actinocorallia sp. API 0066]|uniref:NAD-dependent epimerase/dehydratase family protein n=1 Tax=Actinocorallia sp. API 0066 TaxID=2896846 RepID=UPI001E44003D|nr:NAD(P)-dependent oxidoreductase [Actinocorallia sp. API 0066]MCD0451300.1 NAD(P)-dependent oxidoreductase [Actinocorallia sp. API 0066]
MSGTGRRALVLGATGFLGRHVAARAAVLDGWEVVTASRTPDAADLHLDPSHEGLRDLLRRLRPSAVVNCAGAVAGGPADLVAGNVTLVAALADAVRAEGGRLVHLGSAAEYGRVPEGVPVAESAPPRPVGAYGMTKLAGTELALRAPGAVVLRVFNPVGPGAPRASLLGGVAGQLADGAPEIRTGPLGAVRDYVDVRDVADAVLAAVTRDVTGVINVGSGTATRSRDLVRALLTLVPGRALTEDGEGPARSAAVPWQRADIGTAAAALGWTPATPLDASVRDLWETAC